MPAQPSNGFLSTQPGLFFLANIGSNKATCSGLLVFRKRPFQPCLSKFDEWAKLIMDVSYSIKRGCNFFKRMKVLGYEHG
jgi:hypothetical protein